MLNGVDGPGTELSPAHTDQAYPLTGVIVSPLTVRQLSTPTATAAATITLTPTTTPTSPASGRSYLPLVARNFHSTGPAMVTPTPTVTPEATPILVDDFSDPESGWPTGRVRNGEVGYQNGEYRTHATAGVDVAVAGGLGTVFTDFDLEVSARALNPPFSGAYFLVFRYQDDDNYYYVRVSPSRGNFDIHRNTDGNRTELVAPTNTSAIQTGTAANRLRVVVQGTSIRLYINYELLALVSDVSSPDRGNLLLGAWNYTDAQDLVIHWDDFVIYQAGSRLTNARGRSRLPVLSIPRPNSPTRLH